MISDLETSRISLLDEVKYIRSPLLPSLIDPLRYTDTLLNCTRKAYIEREIYASESRNGVTGAISRVLKQMERPADVKDVVRGLFLSDVSWIAIVLFCMTHSYI